MISLDLIDLESGYSAASYGYQEPDYIAAYGDGLRAILPFLKEEILGSITFLTFKEAIVISPVVDYWEPNVIQFLNASYPEEPMYNPTMMIWPDVVIEVRDWYWVRRFVRWKPEEDYRDAESRRSLTWRKSL